MTTLLRTVQRFATPRAVIPCRLSYSSTSLTSTLSTTRRIARQNNARYYSTESVAWADLPDAEREAALLEKLQTELDAKDVNIIDLSGGCGTMYRIELSSSKFKGKSMLEQHRMVNAVLAHEIKNMHGLTLKTVAV